tara:strand:- start:86 stop:238 length:153 start_codon:yes stop_codon:yes gene_type:complete
MPAATATAATSEVRTATATAASRDHKIIHGKFSGAAISKRAKTVYVITKT